MTFEPGLLSPDARSAAASRMVAAQARFELRLLVRNGEQLLLALVIPLAALIGLTTVMLIPLDESRIDTALPGVWTLALMSTAFTSLAISTAFDRRYAVLKRMLGAGVPRAVLLAGKSAAIGVVIAGQLLLLAAVGLMLGWHPHGNPLWTVTALILGMVAFTGLGLLLGGTLNSEVVLALANLVWLLFVVVGGVVVPLSAGPSWLNVVGSVTPAGALSQALHAVLTDGAAPSPGSLLVLAAWGLIGWAATLKWFSWL